MEHDGIVPVLRLSECCSFLRILDLPGVRISHALSQAATHTLLANKYLKHKHFQTLY